ncbi:MAG: pentapeptide repeat-containing protein [Saprospiraceae bacterium]|nr:pentapeptide repeat-containing protein [Saprospiraceae bacterium]
MMTKGKIRDFLKSCSENSKSGQIEWDTWRSENNVRAMDLKGSDFRGLTFHQYNFAGMDFSESNFDGCLFLESNFVLADLSNSSLMSADFSKTIGTETNFNHCNLSNAKFDFSIYTKSNFNSSVFRNMSGVNALMSGSQFVKADLFKAILISANLSGSNFIGANLQEAVLGGANLSNANLSNANISKSFIYGLSAWNLRTEGLIQNDLVISHDYEDFILTVDDIEIAQFIYLISQNSKLSNVIDKITSKVVLILGRFSNERYRVLIRIKESLRMNGYVPVLFDFEKPESRSLTETIALLGRMSKFIIADLTDAKSVPQELSVIIPGNPSITIQPILLKGSEVYSMFEHWRQYPWVMNVFEYETIDHLKEQMVPRIIQPAIDYYQAHARKK